MECDLSEGKVECDLSLNINILRVFQYYVACLLLCCVSSTNLSRAPYHAKYLPLLCHVYVLIRCISHACVPCVF